MLMHADAAAARHSAPQPPERWAALLDTLGSVEDEPSIIVIGRDGPDLMCALLQGGAPNVTHLCSHERLEGDSATLVIVPHVPSLDWLHAALPALRRTLTTNGRIALCVDPLPSMQTHIRRSLTLLGFTAIHTRSVHGRLVVNAELPAFGLCRCA